MNTEKDKFYGILSIVDIKNTIVDGENALSLDIPPLTTKNIKLVHYPDCQQLIIWLPEQGMFYDNITIQHQESQRVIYKAKIDDILSGSIQLILDSLMIPVGISIVRIEHQNKSSHEITIEKLKEGVLPEAPAIIEQPEDKSDSEPITYRDGFGNPIPNEDLILRSKLLDQLALKFSRKLEFEGTGRSGSIKYIEGDRTAKFYVEMGGGKCIFYVDIPTESNWEKETVFGIQERNDILQFIAEETLRKQTTSSDAYYVIGERDILFMNK
ncbi:MAG: hypothetical protein IPH93_12580 [Saprospiraceae bacterium]|nr:hypothetical protein [Saprospiraceae bacterium]MBK9630968.1 hypothetical protein [Saprospiraceae bacterium]